MKHLDENTIQALLDGELNVGDMEHATRHLSLCDVCTAALLEAEAEIADVNLAFSTENFCPVPTQRIWARIENEIDFLHTAPAVKTADNKTFWQQIVTFVSPSQAAFAGALGAMVLVSLVTLNVIENQTTPQSNPVNVAVIETPRQTQEPPIFKNEIAPRPSVNTIRVNNYPAQHSEARVIKASYSPKTEIQTPRIQNFNPQSAIRNPQSKDLPLSEEKDYLNAIAMLSKSVNADRDLGMNPSFQVEYQRSVGMMNSAIKTMQQRARRNPSDENAKRLLIASYQNKIDLLNTIADKSQMIATLR